MPRVPRAVVPPPVVVALLASTAPFRECRFCDDAALPRGSVCRRHASSDGADVFPCGACRAPVDRLLGSLASDVDRLCEACAFRRKSHDALVRPLSA